jgi:4-hydroxybenzoate polyprenyltransferase
VETWQASRTLEQPWRAALQALRPYQWLKNTLVFVPLLLAYEAGPGQLLAVGVAFGAFCGCASATYLVNDVMDIEADRRHPRKRSRPLAAGSLSVAMALALAAALLIAGFGVSLPWLPPLFSGMLALYVLLALGYTFFFKARISLDVLILAGLYTLRVLAGAVAADVRISRWLLVFSMFLFLSLALLKRYSELRFARARNQSQLERRGYAVAALERVQRVGVVSAIAAVLVVGLFASSPDVQRLYRTPQLLWLICPVLLYWITRLWRLARRGLVQDDPVLFAARDPQSWMAAAVIAVVALTAHHCAIPAG